MSFPTHFAGFRSGLCNGQLKRISSKGESKSWGVNCFPEVSKKLLVTSNELPEFKFQRHLLIRNVLNVSWGNALTNIKKVPKQNSIYFSSKYLLVCFSHFAFALQYINSAANPFLYVFLSDSFQKNVRISAKLLKQNYAFTDTKTATDCQTW